MTHKFVVSFDQGQAESAVRKILANVWSKSNRMGILIPAVPNGAELPSPTLLESPADLDRAVLLAPFMPYNASATAVELLDAKPGFPLALALKPCELRSLDQYARQKSMDLSNVLTISADCLAVFPPEDIGWRLADGALHDLTEEVLRFAPQGGILLSRFQQSCQVCERPYPVYADVQFELIGLDASQNMIVCIKDPMWLEGTDVHLEAVSPDFVEKRQRILDNLVNWRSKALSSAGEKLDPKLTSLDGLMAHLEACPDCQGQLEAMCLQYDQSVLRTQQSVIDWVGTCSGCGTCDYQCPSNYPLFIVIAQLNELYAQQENARVH